MVTYLVYQFFNLILLLMLIRVLLSWFPVNWYKEPFYSLKKFTDFIFEPFRKLVPPIGMIDISPVFAFITVEIISQLCVRVLSFLGL